MVNIPLHQKSLKKTSKKLQKSVKKNDIIKKYVQDFINDAQLNKEKKDKRCDDKKDDKDDKDEVNGDKNKTSVVNFLFLVGFFYLMYKYDIASYFNEMFNDMSISQKYFVLISLLYILSSLSSSSVNKKDIPSSKKDDIKSLKNLMIFTLFGLVFSLFLIAWIVAWASKNFVLFYMPH